MKIDLIFGSEALRHPLTGIGRYCYELLLILRRRPADLRLRYFSLGDWCGDPILELSRKNPAEDRQLKLRRTLSSSRLAVHVYQALIPRVSSWRLRREQSAIYHSPNFLVPPFPGSVVSTVHDLSHILYPDFHSPAHIDLFEIAFEKSLKRANHVITVSESVKRQFVEHYGWSSADVTVIGHGVSSCYHPRSALDSNFALSRYDLSYRGYSLFVGTIEPRKNLNRLLSAYRDLDFATRAMIPLVIVGSWGWKSESTHRLIEQGTREGWLRYLNYVDQQDMPFLYAGALICVYPSLYEGFGLPILEAMASGTPVLTSSVSSMPEVANGAAHLVNPLDVDSMREGLQKCLEDSVWRSEATRRGLRRAAEFSWEKCANATVDLYKSIAH